MCRGALMVCGSISPGKSILSLLAMLITDLTEFCLTICYNSYYSNFADHVT